MDKSKQKFEISKKVAGNDGKSGERHNKVVLEYKIANITEHEKFR